MTSYRHTPPRRGFTLVELLTVVLILGILMGLGVFFYPNFTAKQKMVTAANNLTGMLIRARQQAKRDGLATGLRLIPNGTVCTELQLIQQPDPFPVGRVTQVTNNTTSATVTISGNLQPAGIDPLVAVGDYIDINGGGRLYQVNAVSVNGNITNLTVDAKDATTPLTQSFSNLPNAQSNYRVFAEPRPMAGEETVQLPNTTQITLGSSQINQRGGYYDILFSPNGGLVNQSSNIGQVCLYVADNDTATAGSASLIVAIQMRSGAIGVFPAGPAATPFQYVTPDRSSGM